MNAEEIYLIKILKFLLPFRNSFFSDLISCNKLLNHFYRYKQTLDLISWCKQYKEILVQQARKTSCGE